MEPVDLNLTMADAGYRYRLLAYLGRGSYGTVAKVLDLHTHDIVAMKTCMDRKVLFQESLILDYLCPSEYVVQIRGFGEAQVEGSFVREMRNNSHCGEHGCSSSSQTAFMVMECMAMDLNNFINKELHGSCPSCTELHPPRPAVVKSLMWQLCRGLAYCHSCLLSKDSGGVSLKIADFGLATMVRKNLNGVMQRNEHEYVSLWYRAPELLVKQSTYNCFALNIWSMGCIFAEMLMGEPLFRGVSTEEQLNIIIVKLSGIDAWVRIAQNMGCSAGIDLIAKMLQMNPNSRITAQEALQHQYFSCCGC